MKKKKHPEHVNHERWLVSYADFITLLFAFFVVMFASSQVDTKKVSGISDAFAAAMGLLWLSTVPFTSGLVAQFFGMRYMAMLFGFVFFSHQVGSFIGVWLGGRLYDAYGTYDVVWWLSVALGIAAAIVHLPIREAPAPRLAAAAA